MNHSCLLYSLPLIDSFVCASIVKQAMWNRTKRATQCINLLRLFIGCEQKEKTQMSATSTEVLNFSLSMFDLIFAHLFIISNNSAIV